MVHQHLLNSSAKMPKGPIFRMHLFPSHFLGLCSEKECHFGQQAYQTSLIPFLFTSLSLCPYFSFPRLLPFSFFVVFPFSSFKICLPSFSLSSFDSCIFGDWGSVGNITHVAMADRGGGANCNFWHSNSVFKCYFL